MYRARPELREIRTDQWDCMVHDWLRLVYHGYRETADHKAREINEAFTGRASPLLEGVPDAASGLGDGSGAGLIPLPLATALTLSRDRTAIMRSHVAGFPMSAQTVRIPYMPIVVATTRLENIPYDENTPPAEHLLLSAKNLGVEFIASLEMLADSAFNVVTTLVDRGGSAIGTAEDLQIWTTDGTAPDFTEGIDVATAAVASCSVVGSGAAGVFTFDELTALYFGMPQQYRREANFYGNTVTLKAVNELVTTNGNPVIQGLVDAPRPTTNDDPDAFGTLYGKPVYDIPSGEDNKLFFINPAWYSLGDRSGITVRADVTVRTGSTTWVIEERIDGRLIETTSAPLLDAFRFADFDHV
jgi:HK97 family phage major capsid protein